MTTTARLARNPTASSGTNTATAAATKASRASHRWATVTPPATCCSLVTIPDHHPPLRPSAPPRAWTDTSPRGITPNR